MIEPAIRVLLLAGAAAAVPQLTHPRQPTIEQALLHLSEYVAEYAGQMSLVIGTERYMQEVAGAGSGTVRRTLV